MGSEPKGFSLVERWDIMLYGVGTLTVTTSGCKNKSKVVKMYVSKHTHIHIEIR